MLGNYTKSRQLFQDKIITKLLDDAWVHDTKNGISCKTPTDPWIVFTAGAMVSKIVQPILFCFRFMNHQPMNIIIHEGSRQRPRNARTGLQKSLPPPILRRRRPRCHSTAISRIYLIRHPITRSGRRTHAQGGRIRDRNRHSGGIGSGV